MLSIPALPTFDTRSIREISPSSNKPWVHCSFMAKLFSVSAFLWSEGWRLWFWFLLILPCVCSGILRSESLEFCGMCASFIKSMWKPWFVCETFNSAIMAEHRFCPLNSFSYLFWSYPLEKTFVHVWQSCRPWSGNTGITRGFPSVM